jgi:alpha-beta hydrolase superfamily lysophospholipase
LTEHHGSPRGESTPFWFGPEDRPLFGWLHLPADGVVRGGVVLCQPLGIEAICTYYTYRMLAEVLAERGLAVLRFDYDGTGDSDGHETDPDRVDDWLSSLVVATDVLVGTGVTRLGLVGVRMGGLFAAHEAARRDGVDALVLWDTCLSGGAFLREQRFLRLLSSSGGGGGPEDDAVEAPGLRFEPETVRALSGLDLTRSEGRLAERTLVLTPPDLSRPRRLQRRLDGHRVDWQEATGQDRLLDSSLQAPPIDAIGRIADWLSEALDGTPVTANAPPLTSTAVVGRTGSGRSVVERTVRLGSLDLFGVVTEPAGGARGPTIVLVDEGNTHHIGQARIWVDLARRLAPSGLRVLRFDLSGNGDSGARPGQATHVARAPEAIDDVYEAMRGIAPEDPADVVLVGFCSGAYQVIEQALAHPPRGICVINPSFSFRPPEPAGSADRPARQVTKRWFVRLVDLPLRRLGRDRNPAESSRWAKALDVGTWPVALAKRYPGIPAAVWWAVNHTLLENTGIGSLERIVDHGVDTLLICGPGDFLPVSLGSEGRIRKLRTSGDFHLELLDELDHASWVRRQRERLIEVVDSYLAAAYGTVPLTRDPSADLRVGSGRPA